MREFPPEIEAIIDSEFRNPSFGVRELVERAGITSSHLRELTAHHRGCSPHDLIERKRLEHARILLQQKSHRVSEVYKRVGYANSRTFRNAFHRRFGICPSDYMADRTFQTERQAPDDLPAKTSGDIFRQ